MGTKIYDIFMWAHFIGGIILYKFGLSWIMANGLHLLYEFVDDLIYPITFPEFKKFPDTIVNSLGDHVFMNLGYFVAPFIFTNYTFKQKYLYILFILPIIGSAFFVTLRELLVKLGVNKKYL